MCDDVKQPASGSDTATNSENNVVKNSATVPIGIDDMTSNDFFFDLSAHYGVQEEKLRNKVQMFAFRNAMNNNKHLFKDKIILDVCCGTGILSMFAVKAGAAKVIAVDSSKILELTRKIIIDNDMDTKIQAISGEITEIDLGVEKVDIIISDWVGYCLFNNSVLEKVLYARDKWLKPGGVIFPDRGSLTITAIEDFNNKDYNINWWNNVHTFDMSCIRKAAIKEPFIADVNPNRLVTNSYLIKDLDLYTIQKSDLDFTSQFHLKVERNDFVHGLLTYFNVEFSKCRPPIKFSTSPMARYTRWKQCIFYLNEYITAKKGEKISGIFKIKYNRNIETSVDFEIKLDFKGEYSEVHETNSYNMGSLLRINE